MDHQLLQQAAANHLNCYGFETSMFLNPHLQYQQENLVSEWGAGPSSSEDHKNLGKSSPQPLTEPQNTLAPVQIPIYSYQPYQLFEIASSSQAPREFVTDQAMVENGMTVHPSFDFKEYIKDENQAEILDLDSQKMAPFQPQEEENQFLDRCYYKEENGSQSPDFCSVSTTMSPSSGSEVTSYYDPSRAMQLSSPPLSEYSMGVQGGAWKSNEKRKSKTYNCRVCNKWFTSSGHLKRHFNTTLHKTAEKQSGSLEPLDQPSSSHHHSPPHEENFHFQPDQPPPQEEFQHFPHYTNEIPVQTTSFSYPLPSFSQFQSSLINSNGFPSAERPLPPAAQSVAEVTSSDQPAVHRCVDCDKTFNKACYLTQHNKSFHSGDKPYKCQRCGKRFTEEYLLSEHMSKHTGEKPNKCDMCPKQFNHKTDLRRHMCHHSGDKPYACDFCGKGFIRKDHMLKHADTHKKKSVSSSYKKMDVNVNFRVM